MNDLPILCTLGADDLRARRADLLTGLAARAIARETLDSGMRFRFDASSETLSQLLRVIDSERQCCRFLHFELTVTPNLGPIALSVTGPVGTREFLTGLLDKRADRWG